MNDKDLPTNRQLLANEIARLPADHPSRVVLTRELRQMSKAEVERMLGNFAHVRANLAEYLGVLGRKIDALGEPDSGWRIDEGLRARNGSRASAND